MEQEHEKERKVAVEADAKQSSSSSGGGGGHLAKATVDNSNEIVVLKDKIRELESKLLARDDQQLVSNDASSLSDNKLEVLLLNFA